MCRGFAMLIFAFSLKHRPQLLPQAQELPLYLGWWEGTLPSSWLHMASPGQRKAAPCWPSPKPPPPLIFEGQH